MSSWVYFLPSPILAYILKGIDKVKETDKGEIDKGILISPMWGFVA